MTTPARPRAVKALRAPLAPSSDFPGETPELCIVLHFSALQRDGAGRENVAVTAEWVRAFDRRDPPGIRGISCLDHPLAAIQVAARLYPNDAPAFLFIDRTATLTNADEAETCRAARALTAITKGMARLADLWPVPVDAPHPAGFADALARLALVTGVHRIAVPVRPTKTGGGFDDNPCELVSNGNVHGALVRCLRDVCHAAARPSLWGD